MFQVGERKRNRRTLEVEKPSSRRRLDVESITENGPLRGAVVCLTGLPADEKTRLHRHVEKLGGRCVDIVSLYFILDTRNLKCAANRLTRSFPPVLTGTLETWILPRRHILLRKMPREQNMIQLSRVRRSVSFPPLGWRNAFRLANVPTSDFIP